MDAGELVPDEIVIKVVDEHFAAGGPLKTASSSTASRARWCRPRSSSRCCSDHPLDLVLDIEVPTEIVLDRIAGRRVCVNCGATYHVNMPPSVDWTCDVCGGHVVQRDDDTEEAVANAARDLRPSDGPDHRLLRPNLGKLVVVDGVGDGDDVHERLVKEIDERFDPARR